MTAKMRACGSKNIPLHLSTFAKHELERTMNELEADLQKEIDALQLKILDADSGGLRSQSCDAFVGRLLIQLNAFETNLQCLLSMVFVTFDIESEKKQMQLSRYLSVKFKQLFDCSYRYVAKYFDDEKMRQNKKTHLELIENYAVFRPNLDVIEIVEGIFGMHLKGLEEVCNLIS